MTPLLFEVCSGTLDVRPGMMGSLGHSKAFGQLLKLRVHGVPAWCVRRAYYLMQMPGWSRRLRILSDWAFAAAASAGTSSRSAWIARRHCCSAKVRPEPRSPSPRKTAPADPAPPPTTAPAAIYQASNSPTHTSPARPKSVILCTRLEGVHEYRFGQGIGDALMEIEVLDDSDAVARKAAAIIAAEARSAVSARGRFIMAVSGGHTPWLMLRALAGEERPVGTCRHGSSGRARGSRRTPGSKRHPFAPVPAGACPAAAGADPCHAGGSDRSGRRSPQATPLCFESLPARRRFSTSCTWDLGRTATRRPWCPAIRSSNVTESDVALTGVYQGRRRMTLTYPIINRARRILWLVTGSEKVGMLERLLAGDPSIPAGRVRRDLAAVVADRAAAGTPLPAAARPGELGVSVALGRTSGSKGIVR